MTRLFVGGPLMLACLAAAWLDYRIETGKRQAEAISALREKGVEIISASWPCQQWLGALFGEDTFQDVQVVVFPAKTKLTAENLSELGSFPNLHHLVLADTNLDDTGMAKVAMLQSLRVLNLGGTQVSDGALAQLAKLQQLEELVLTKTSVTNASLHCLADLKKLQSVDLKKNSGHARWRGEAVRAQGPAFFHPILNIPGRDRFSPGYFARSKKLFLPSGSDSVIEIRIKTYHL